jgi:hypothetical protein
MLLLQLLLLLPLLLLLTQRQVLVDVGVPVDLERHHLLIALIREWLGICRTHDKAIMCYQAPGIGSVFNFVPLNAAMCCTSTTCVLG